MIAPGATLGMLGGGQLGRMFAQAAHALGYRVAVLDPDPESVAGAVADLHLRADYRDPAALDELATRCAAITTEFENVPADSLEALAARRPVRPGAQAVAVLQDRLAEKRFLARHGFAVAPFMEISAGRDLEFADGSFFPGIFKCARFGYDGKGQAAVATPRELAAAFHALGRVPCVLEQRIRLATELSVVVARDGAGRVVRYPVAENRHRDGILDVSIVPAAVPAALAGEAETAACEIARWLDYEGVLAVEFFVDAAGRLLVNEIAPRPHNSGHFTLDAVACSQFEQQVRALCGLPPGDTTLRGPVVMANLLGELWAGGTPAWDAVLAHPRAKLHLYGKAEARPGRKMGHLTVSAPSREQALEEALELRGRLVRVQ